MGTQILMMTTNTDVSQENGRKTQNTVSVETSKGFPESETEVKCLMVFLPLLPVVKKGRR